MDNQQRLERLEHKLDMLLSHLGVLASANGAGGHEGHGHTPPAPPALEVDIDGPRGNPEVRFIPKRWEGANYKGKTFSECDPDFLDMLAEAFDYFARKEDETSALDKNGGPKSRWTRLDAGRARAWAKRLRGSHGGANGASKARARPAAVAAPAIDDFSAGFPAQEEDDDIPFLAPPVREVRGSERPLVPRGAGPSGAQSPPRGGAEPLRVARTTPPATPFSRLAQGLCSAL